MDNENKLLQKLDEDKLLGFGEITVTNAYSTPTLVHQMIKISSSN